MDGHSANWGIFNHRIVSLSIVKSLFSYACNKVRLYYIDRPPDPYTEKRFYKRETFAALNYVILQMSFIPPSLLCN